MNVSRNLYKAIEAEAFRIASPDRVSAVAELMSSHLAPYLDDWSELGGPCSAFGEPLVPTDSKSRAYQIWKDALCLGERHKFL